MEPTTLLSLLESDREMVLAELNRDRSPASAQAALEKALDRVSLRYAEQATDAAAREAAQLSIRTIKSALPLMDAVGEVRRWERTPDRPTARRMKPASMGFLAVGAVLVLAVLLGLLITGRRLLGPLAFIESIIPAALGMGALFLAGMKYGSPEKKPEEAPSLRDEFLIDPEKVWHQLKGMLLLADSAVESARRPAPAPKAPVASGPLDAAQTELFSGLLENCYAQDNPDSREMAESIRFFLHGAGIEVADYEKGRETWFEFLPARRSGTIRPALVHQDKLIKKGLAAN